LSRLARNLFPEFSIRLYDKNSESDYFFPPPKSAFFFQQHWELAYFFRKNPFMLYGRSLSSVIEVCIDLIGITEEGEDDTETMKDFVSVMNLTDVIGCIT
jgi:hypothetical protein